IQNRRSLAEILADALFLSERISHSGSPSFNSDARKQPAAERLAACPTCGPPGPVTKAKYQVTT
ncbi:MAG: hypothetical protein OEV05_14250, partial [Gammaproteobacteria bacterium]|nr:hypothetical protein [Gammaproteobacteria bacterium]